MKWLSKNEREDFEIQGFIDAYSKLPHGRTFTIECVRDKPDRIVKDTKSNERFGVELTSVYLDDRSVPDKHMKRNSDTIPFNSGEIEAYEKRIIAAVKDKVHKAKKGYDTSFPIILSVYVNEYISIHMGEKYWRSFAKRNDLQFDSIAPFAEVVFWPLPNNIVVSVRPE